MKATIITIFASALVVFGFAGFASIPAQAGEEEVCERHDGAACDTYNESGGHQDRYSEAEINELRRLVEYNDSKQFEGCAWEPSKSGARLCHVTDENGSKQITGIEIPDHWVSEESKGERFASRRAGNGHCKYIDGRLVCGFISGLTEEEASELVASFEGLLAPGGASISSFEELLASDSTIADVEDYFADREDGRDDDRGEFSGGDFGGGDGAAASTAGDH